MERGDFLQQMGWLLMGLLPGWSRGDGLWRRGVLPPFLREGDLIGLTAPSGAIQPAEVAPAVSVLQAWGFRVQLGETLGLQDGSLGGSDAQRAADLQRMIDNPLVCAIFCARGGYGVTRMVDALNLGEFRRHPKWIVGFSDITALHLHIWRQTGVISLHSKMCGSFPAQWLEAPSLVQETLLSIRHALTGHAVPLACPPHMADRSGLAERPLVGGNLSMIHTCMGTRSEIDTRGAILFLEDVGEYPYSIDRMLTNLQRAGKFNQLQGLVIGGFTQMKKELPGEAFGRSLEQMVLEKVPAGFPVCFGFPIGHQLENYALLHGQRYRLEVTEDGSTLEISVPG